MRLCVRNLELFRSRFVALLLVLLAVYRGARELCSLLELEVASASKMPPKTGGLRFVLVIFFSARCTGELWTAKFEIEELALCRSCGLVEVPATPLLGNSREIGVILKGEFPREPPGATR